MFPLVHLCLDVMFGYSKVWLRLGKTSGNFGQDYMQSVPGLYQEMTHDASHWTGCEWYNPPLKPCPPPLLLWKEHCDMEAFQLIRNLRRCCFIAVALKPCATILHPKVPSTSRMNSEGCDSMLSFRQLSVRAGWKRL